MGLEPKLAGKKGGENKKSSVSDTFKATRRGLPPEAFVDRMKSMIGSGSGKVSPAVMRNVVGSIQREKVVTQKRQDARERADIFKKTGNQIINKTPSIKEEPTNK